MKNDNECDNLVNNNNNKLNNNNNECDSLVNNNNNNRRILRIITIVIFLHVTAVGIVLPSLGDVVLNLFNDDSSAAGLFIASMSALQSLIGFFFNPFAGDLADYYGRKPFMLIAEFGIATQAILLGFYHHISLFVIASIIYGVTGVATTIVNSIVVDITNTYEELAKNFGLIGGGFGLGFLIGVGIGASIGTITDNDLKIPFIVSLCFQVSLTIPFTFIFLPETLNFDTRTAKQFKREELISRLTNIKENLSVLGTTPRLKMLAGLNFFLTLSASVVAIFLVYAEERYDWKASEVGAYMFTFGVSIVIAQVCIVRIIVKKIHPDKALQLCIWNLIIAYILWGVAFEGWMLYVVLFFAIPGLTIAVILSSEVSKEVPSELQGKLQGGLQSLRVIADVFGSISMGLIYSYSVSDDAIIYLPGSAFYLSAIFMSFTLFFHHRAKKYTALSENDHHNISTTPTTTVTTTIITDNDNTEPHRKSIVLFDDDTS